MATYLQAYANKTKQVRLIVTLKVIKDVDVNNPEIKTYNFPKDRSLFKSLTDELYNSANPPTYVTKQDFKDKFINKTLKLDLDLVDPSDLTDQYNELFSLETQEVKAALEKVTEQMSTKIDILKEQFNKSLSNEQETYKKETINDSLLSDLDEFEESDFDSEEFFEKFGIPLEDDDFSSLPDKLMPPGFPLQPEPGDNPKPATAKHKPSKNLFGLTNSKKRELDSLPASIRTQLNGTAGGRLTEPVPAVPDDPSIAHYKGENNAGVQFKRDEIYGLRGHTKSGACYLYAGRSPNDIRTEIEIDGADPSQNILLRKPNDLVRDSSYIYISQKSNPRDLLKVAGGTFTKVAGDKNARDKLSLVAIKSDDVAIMSRVGGIRLITGTDSKGSGGQDLYSKFGIDLIAGNDDSDLQPLVKGDNLITYLKGLSKSISEVRAILNNAIKIQIDFISAVSKHSHPDSFSIFTGAMATGNPTSLNGGKDFPSQEVLQAGFKAMLELTQAQQNITNQMRNQINNDQNGFEKVGEYRITSQKNRTT